MASRKVTRIPEDRRTPKYLNCQMTPGPLLEGSLESFRAHMPAIFQSSPGHHVFASILPAAALLDFLLWDHPLLCQRRCWRLAWWQTAGGATEAASVCLVKADSCLPGTRSEKMRGCQEACASTSMLARQEGKCPLAFSGVLGPTDLGGISQLSGPVCVCHL